MLSDQVIEGDGDARGVRDQRPSGRLIAFITLGLVAFHLWTSSRVGGPSVLYDEAGYLGSARWLAGGAEWQMPRSPTYAVGYSVVLAPVFALLHTADAQWRAVLTVNAVLLASVFPLLFAVLTRVAGVPRRAASVAALVGALAPAVVAAGISAIAENLVLPLVLLSVLATWSMAHGDGERRRGWPYGYGLTVAALVTTHPRFTLVLPLAVLVIVVCAWLGLAGRRVALINGVLLGVAALAGYALNRLVVGARWKVHEQLEGGTGDWLKLVQSGKAFWDLVLTAVGQGWYLAVGSLGIGVVGIVVTLRIVRGRASGLDVGSAGPVPMERRFAMGAAGAMAGAVFVTSVVFFAQNQFRADHWVYGRHNDSFTPLWIGLGLSALVAHRSVRARLTEVAIAAVTIGVFGALVIANRDPMDLGGDFSPFAVPAIVRYVAHDPSALFWRATIWGLIATGLLAVLVTLSGSERVRSQPRVRPAISAVTAVCLLGWFVYAGFATVDGTASFEHVLTDHWHTPPQIDELGIKHLAIESETARSLPTLTYAFHLPAVDVSVYTQSRGQHPAVPFALARVDDRARVRAGDRIALLDDHPWWGFVGAPGGLAVWVAPGPDQRRLAAAGHLLPAGFPASLPVKARRVSIRLDDRPGGSSEPSTTPGGRVQVAVTGRHLGTGSPWPDYLSFRRDGRVQVRARLTRVGAPAAVGSRSAGELDRWVQPGGTWRSTVTIVAVDDALQPLAPGRYRVDLGVGQEVGLKVTWFAPAGPAASFTFQVRR